MEREEPPCSEAVADARWTATAYLQVPPQQLQQRATTPTQQQNRQQHCYNTAHFSFASTGAAVPSFNPTHLVPGRSDWCYLPFTLGWAVASCSGPVGQDWQVHLLPACMLDRDASGHSEEGEPLRVEACREHMNREESAILQLRQSRRQRQHGRATAQPPHQPLQQRGSNAMAELPQPPQRQKQRKLQQSHSSHNRASCPPPAARTS